MTNAIHSTGRLCTQSLITAPSPCPDYSAPPILADFKLPSYQPHSLQTRMAVFADDDVVVDGDAERAGDVDDRLGHLDIGLRGCRIAARVVVDQDQRGCR